MCMCDTIRENVRKIGDVEDVWKFLGIPRISIRCLQDYENFLNKKTITNYFPFCCTVPVPVWARFLSSDRLLCLSIWIHKVKIAKTVTT